MKMTTPLFKAVEGILPPTTSLLVDFDEAEHSYSHNGVRVPSVTQILKDAGVISDYSGIPQHYRDRGTAIHSYIERTIAGETPEMSEHVGFEVAADKLIEKYKGSVIGTEIRFTDQAFGYAGTCDLLVRLDDDSVCVIEVKTGKAQRWADLQASAYAKALGATSALVAELNTEGKLKLSKVPLHSAFSEFLEALTGKNKKVLDDLSAERIYSELQRIDSKISNGCAPYRKRIEELEAEIKELKELMKEDVGELVEQESQKRVELGKVLVQRPDLRTKRYYLKKRTQVAVKKPEDVPDEYWSVDEKKLKAEIKACGNSVFIPGVEISVVGELVVRK